MLTLLLLVGVVWAGPVDVFGFGAQSMGRGGGGVALVNGPEGVFLNPAGLYRMPGARAGAGYALLRSSLDPIPGLYWDTNQDGVIDDTDPPLDAGPDYGRADGLMFTLGRPIGGRFGVGLDLFLPVDRLLRIQTFEPAIPSYFMYNNRLSRFELALGFGWEQLPGISVGGAVEVIARARYHITLTFEGTVSGASGDDEQLGDLVGGLKMDTHEMTLDLVPDFAPIVSLNWDVGELLPPLDGLSLAGTYRGSTGLPVDIQVDMQANITAEQLGDLEPMVFSVVLPLQLEILDHYVPERVSLGAGWQFRGRAESRDPDWSSIYVDVHRTSWDKMELAIAQVTGGEVSTQVMTLSDPGIADGNDYAVTLRATWGVRGGAEIWLPVWDPGDDVGTLRVALRAGAGYDPTPLVSQGAQSSLLDADRAFYTVGVGVEHGDPFGLIRGPVHWNLFGQYHVIASGSLQLPDQRRAGAPVDNVPIPIGGSLLAAGVEWSIDY